MEGKIANKIELLAPAGNMDCLVAAVRSGADAVYFGGSAFNARRGAENFAGDELKSAVEYCRLHRVNTNVTLNTLLFDNELEKALAFAGELYGLGVTAVIVQDIGLAALIRRELPGLAMHASTQMGVHDAAGLQYCIENGFSRAVLSREVSLSEIKRMSEGCDIELEFFCHGALCMGFSGSCLYSSMAGERSGNRGTCAQPCRKKASVLSLKRAGEEEYCLSANDICMIDELAKLRDAGVCCLKIEGRMKQPEYVATVTRNYRAALDALYAKDLGDNTRFDAKAARSELYEIFNRGDFSTSHLYFDSVRTGRAGHAQPSNELIAKAHESLRGEAALYEVKASLDITVGKKARLTLAMQSEPYYSASAEGPFSQEPQKPLDVKRLEEQIKKLGGTVFFAQDCEISGGGFITVSALNAMRREAALSLEGLLKRAPEARQETAAEEDFERRALDITAAYPQSESPLLYERVRNREQAVSSHAYIIGIDPAVPEELDLKATAGIKAERILILPNVLITEGARQAYLRLLASGAFTGVEVNNVGQLRLVKGLGLKKVIAGVGLNVLNSKTALKLISEGATHIMPSLELTGRQLASLAERCGSALIVNTYGRAPLMQLMHCPVKEYRGCQGCRGDAGTLVDGDGRRFPLRSVRFSKEGYCLVRMLNCAVTDIRDRFKESGIKAYAVAVTPEEGEEKDITRGHWSRAVE